MSEIQKTHLEASEWAQPLLQQLEETKTNFRKQIFSLVADRQPFSNLGKHGLSNLAVFNSLTSSPTMVSEAKNGVANFKEYGGEYPQMIPTMEAFGKLLEQPEIMKKHRDTLHEKAFHPDKEEVSEYLLMIAAYVDIHLDEYIKYIQAIDKVEKLTHSPDGDMDNFHKTFDALEKQSKAINTELLKPLLAVISMEYQKGGLSEKGLNSIADTFKRFAEVENSCQEEFLAQK